MTESKPCMVKDIFLNEEDAVLAIVCRLILGRGYLFLLDSQRSHSLQRENELFEEISSPTNFSLGTYRTNLCRPIRLARTGHLVRTARH